MADPLRSLLVRGRQTTRRCSLQGGVAVGCAISAAAVPVAATRVGFPQALAALAAIPIAAGVAFARRRPADATVARGLDERFATGELLATAVTLADDAAGGSIVVAQANALATRLADADLADGRTTRAMAAAGVALALSVAFAARFAPSVRAGEVARQPSSAGAGSSDERERAAADRSPPPSVPTHAGEAESADASRATASSDAAAVREAGRSPAGGVGVASSTLTVAPIPSARTSDVRAALDGAPAAGDGAGVAGASTIGDARGTASRGSPDIAEGKCGPITDRARDAIDAGRVPAASRALVRAFFDPGDVAR